MIKSPTFGRVEKVSEEGVLVYIGVDDSHKVFAPVSGIIESINSEKKLFKTISEDFTLYTAQPPKTERLLVEFKNPRVAFYLEVGHPEYVTNNVALYYEEGDIVEQSDHIGDILIGSRAMIYMPKGWKPIVKNGDFLVGGKTTIYIRSDVDNHTDEDRVLITVTHGECFPGKERNCDRRAKQAAKMLDRMLSAKGFSTKLLVAKTRRHPSTDQNRPWHSRTEFSQEFEESLNDPNFSFTFDVHSFPRGSFENVGTPLVILHPDSSWDFASLDLQKFLGGGVSTLLKGSQINWIVYASRQSRIPAILLEFIEDETVDIKPIITEIVEWFTKRHQKPESSRGMWSDNENSWCTIV
jgi:hypothetical protein